MIGIHCKYLARVVSSLVSILVVHVVRDTYFCENARPVAHVVHSFLLNCGKLIPEAISYGRLTNFDCEGWRKIFTSQNAKDIDVPDPIPTKA